MVIGDPNPKAMEIDSLSHTVVVLTSHDTFAGASITSATNLHL